ncbi:MAG: thiamine-binding protein [Clostridium sp.]|nr:thiamine-binding protein [Clostridium sp.]
MATANVSLQIIPCVDENEIYPIVDKVIDLIAKSGIKHVVGPMETTMEGELHQLLEIVKRAQDICIAEGVERVLTMVKIDYKREGVTMDEKISKYR